MGTTPVLGPNNTQPQRLNWDHFNLVVNLITLVFALIVICEILAAHLPTFSDKANFVFGIVNTFGASVTTIQWFFPGLTFKEVWQSVRRWFIEIFQPENDRDSSLPDGNVPPPQHIFFGRQQILQKIKDSYTKGSYIQIIGGMRGIGKSRIALAYAHDSTYKFVLWINASSIKKIQESCSDIQSILNIPFNAPVGTSNHGNPSPIHVVSSSQPQPSVSDAVLIWLQNNDNSDWLLVLDGYRDPAMLPEILNDEERKEYSQLVRKFLSQPHVDAARHILVTTDLPRTNFAELHYLKVQVMENDDGDNAASLFLYHYYGREQAETDEDKKIAKEIVKELGYLPLALACAGMFCAQSRSLKHFLDVYRVDPRPFFHYELISPMTIKMMKSNWQRAYTCIHQKEYANDAAPLLKLCAFFAPEPIPEELLCLATDHPDLKNIINNQAIQQRTIDTLQRFSLIELLEDKQNRRMFSVHTVLQHAIRSGIYDDDGMKSTALRTIAKSAVHALNTKLPAINSELQEIDYTHWQVYSDYLPHAYTCCRHIMKLEDVVTNTEAIELLYKTGCFLTLQAKFAEAEELLRKVLEIKENQSSNKPGSPSQAAIELALGKLYYAQGIFVDADTHYKAATQASPTPDERVVIFIQQGHLEDDLGNDVQALVCYKKAEEELQTIGSPKSLLNALLLSNRALLKMKPLYMLGLASGVGENSFETIEGDLKKALISFLQTGDDHPYTRECKANLVTLYILQNKISPSKVFAIKVELGTEPPMQMTVQAEQCYRRVIDSDTLGRERPQVAIYHNNLATLYYLKGKALKSRSKQRKADECFEKAKDAYKKAEEIYLKSCPRHPMLAIIQKNYATLLKNIDADNHYRERTKLQKSAKNNDQFYLGSNKDLFKEQSSHQNTALAVSRRGKSQDLTISGNNKQTTQN